jgi:hypothetical protein
MRQQQVTCGGLYVNKMRLSSGLHEAGNLRLKVGFNKWQLLHQVRVELCVVRMLHTLCLAIC